MLLSHHQELLNLTEPLHFGIGGAEVMDIIKSSTQSPSRAGKVYTTWWGGMDEGERENDPCEGAA